MFLSKDELPGYEEFKKSYVDVELEGENRTLNTYPVFYGEDNYSTTKEFKKLMSENNPMHNEEIKKKFLQVVRSEEYRKNMSKIKTGTIHSEETKKKMSEIAKKNGTGKWNLGVSKKDETKKKMSEYASNRPRIKCDKCGDGYTKPNFEKHYLSCRGEKRDLYKKINGKVQRVKS